MDRILLYNSGGGLGDSIQLIPLILSLKNHFKNSKIFYLGAHPNHFDDKLKEYNIKIPSLELNLKYFGFRWWQLLYVKKNLKRIKESGFDLIIDLQSKFRNSMILKKIPHVHFYSTTLNNLFSTKKNSFKSKDHLENLNIFLEEKIKPITFSCNKLPKNLLDEAKKLLPKSNYIGFSITPGNEYRKKSWSIYKFISLANKCQIKNKIPVFFIEKSQEHIIEKIKNQVPFAIFPETNSKLCIFIAKIVEAQKLIPENTPHSIAAGIVYYVSIMCNLNISKKDIHFISQISEVTVNKCCKKLEKYNNKLLPPTILQKYNV